MANNMIPSKNVSASCSKVPCCQVDVQLDEIKKELKGLRTMVDFAVRLLSKLVPASIDDFQNILNGSTGLTVTTVPHISTSEADKLEIEIVSEPMEIEQNTDEGRNVDSTSKSSKDDLEDVQIDSRVASPRAPSPTYSESDSSYSPCPYQSSSIVDFNTKLPSEETRTSIALKDENEQSELKETGVEVSLDTSQTKFDSPFLVNSDTDNGNTAAATVSNLQCSDQNITSLQVTSSPLSSCHASLNTIDKGVIFEERQTQKQFSDVATEKNVVTDILEKEDVTRKEDCSKKTELELWKILNDLKPSFDPSTSSTSTVGNVDNFPQTAPNVPQETLSESNLDPLENGAVSCNADMNFGTVKVKEELPSECDVSCTEMEEKLHLTDELKEDSEVIKKGIYLSDGMLPVCVVLKKEDEDNSSQIQEVNSASENFSYNNCDGLTAGNPANTVVREMDLKIDNIFQNSQSQVASPLKPLFGSALVSKLKQKIQEKIQAAVGPISEETPINESENGFSVNTKRCLNVSVAFKDDYVNSNQVTVTENKLRPKFYQCKSCAKIFFCTIALHAHKNNCSGMRKQYHCNSCPLIFKSRAVLYNHRRLHAKKKYNKCDFCGKDFILKSTLWKHKLSLECVGTRSYKTMPQYFCSECGEGFMNSANLALHQKLHEVDKKLSNNSSDQTEVKQNRNVRRYPCGYCNEAFIDRRSVTLHEKLHTDKEFAAFDQERRMIQRRHQIMMMLQKQQEQSTKKKFGCKYCGRCYPIELLLDMHTRLHHAIS